MKFSVLSGRRKSSNNIVKHHQFGATSSRSTIPSLPTYPVQGTDYLMGRCSTSKPRRRRTNRPAPWMVGSRSSSNASHRSLGTLVQFFSNYVLISADGRVPIIGCPLPRFGSLTRWTSMPMQNLHFHSTIDFYQSTRPSIG